LIMSSIEPLSSSFDFPPWLMWFDKVANTFKITIYIFIKSQQNLLN
jgi:hypothetical protein